MEAALAATERRYHCTVYQCAAAVGGNVRAWGHVRMFTPWSMNVSPPARRALGSPAARPVAKYAERLLCDGAVLVVDRVRD